MEDQLDLSLREMSIDGKLRSILFFLFDFSYCLHHITSCANNIPLCTEVIELNIVTNFSLTVCFETELETSRH